MTKGHIIKAHLALFGTHAIYAANHFIAKGIMPNKLSPTPFVFFRVLGAAILFWFIKAFIKEKVETKDFLRLGLCGLFGASCNQLFFFHGLSLTSPVDTAIIMTSAPAVVFILSMILLKEKATKNKIVGLSIGAVGALGLVWYGQTAEGTSSFLGNLFIFINVLFYSLYQVTVKPLMKKYHFITIISWVFLFGLLFLMPLGLKDVLYATNYSLFNTNTYLVIAYVIIFTTFLAFLFNIYALRQVSPSVAGSYSYVQPALSFAIVLVLSLVFHNNRYNEDLNIIKFICCFFVIIGVYLISKKPKLR
ncbi:EamA family transporter [Tamlana fucoidanivorans]|uniref:EamA/RhaT family transporter n=1 Tax=Allotamlana fucoidanivorans TaxID=2583814 RepID=A0A5C4SK32_9FLAO|nr:EamA family transporter [Tamlana fucoidanivorans]TNJ44215.1 EamA/RhaT family transporter [Tamlana fucoidanivorans]